MKNKGQKISQAFQRWLLALVAIAFLIYSFYKDLKNRYGEKNDVREYIRIKRRKF